MPLSEPAEREVMHARDITVRGYFRTDGLFDVDARLVDTKPYGFANDQSGEIPPGRPLHEMLVRITIDERLTIVACEAVTEHGPYEPCRGAPVTFDRLVGLALKPGFLRAANERLRGAAGCTHIREMLQQVATVAHQTMWPVKSRQEATALKLARRRGERGEVRGDDDGAQMLNSCFAYASDGTVVRSRWPQLYTGSAEIRAAPQLAATPSER